MVLLQRVITRSVTTCDCRTRSSTEIDLSLCFSSFRNAAFVNWILVEDAIFFGYFSSSSFGYRCHARPKVAYS